jgi:pimeloyl-ACP methyl ester carboxylesterase
MPGVGPVREARRRAFRHARDHRVDSPTRAVLDSFDLADILQPAPSLLSPPPTDVRPSGGVDRFTWGSTGDPILLVPGWGAHPFYFGDLVRALVEGKNMVVASWPSKDPNKVSSTAHYDALAAEIDQLRNGVDAPIKVVAESLGAAFVLGSGLLHPHDIAVFVSPGLFPRFRQVVSLRAASDLVRLVSRDELPLHGWRLESVSDNEEFRDIVRSANLAPSHSDRRYVSAAVRATLKTAIRPRGAGKNLIMSGSLDRLLTPFGSAYLAWRLSDADTRLRVFPHAGHGILWDAHVGRNAATEIAEFFQHA